MSDRLDFALEEVEQQNAALDTSHWAHLIDLVVGECHPDQRAFVEDDGRYIAGLVGRGGGKTTGGRARFAKRLLSTPGARCFYLAHTRLHAERLMWNPIKELFRNLGFVEGRDVVYNETKLLLSLPRTDAQLQLWGADKLTNIEKLRGESYHEVGIDEGASQKDKLIEYLIDQVFGPRLLGALFVIGSPGSRLKGLFYEITRRGSTKSRLWKEREAHPGWMGWSLHRWTLRGAVEATGDRPIPALVELLRVQELEIATKQLSPNNPVRRREFDGEWAADDTINIYKYRIHNEAGELWNQWDPERIGPMRIAKLPSDFNDWVHVVAMDPGYSDPTAVNVFATAISDPTRTMYHRLCFERTGLYARLVAEALIGASLKPEAPAGILGAIGEWPNGFVADPSHQMAQALLDELANVYGIVIEPAKKGFEYKVGAIEGVNGDFFDGRIKVLKDSELEEQLLDLQWDETKTGARVERAGQPNHSTDCLVYGRVKMQTFLSAAPPVGAPPLPLDPRDPNYVPPFPAPQAPMLGGGGDSFGLTYGGDYSSLLR